MRKVLLMFSAGQDSTTLLGWCLKRFEEVHLITFSYGQKHIIEVSLTKSIIKKFNKRFTKWNGKIKSSFIYKINNIKDLNKNSLTSNIGFKKKNGLPNTFVPGRNILFYSLSAAYAYDKKIENIVSGVCQTDYSGYPDCRNETIKSLEKSINLGMEKNYKFYTPLMWKDKSEIWQMAKDIGGQDYLNFIIKNTNTCYKGDRKKFNPWGYGCGKCPACLLRAKGWKKFLNNDIKE